MGGAGRARRGDRRSRDRPGGPAPGWAFSQPDRGAMLQFAGNRSHNIQFREPAASDRGTSQGAATASWSRPARGAGERGGMPEATISLEGHAEELAVFGSRDQYLRQIRDAIGVKVLARHGEVRIEGDP